MADAAMAAAVASLAEVARGLSESNELAQQAAAVAQQRAAASQARGERLLESSLAAQREAAEYSRAQAQLALVKDSVPALQTSGKNFAGWAVAFLRAIDSGELTEGAARSLLKTASKDVEVSGQIEDALAARPSSALNADGQPDATKWATYLQEKRSAGVRAPHARFAVSQLRVLYGGDLDVQLHKAKHRLKSRWRSSAY